jgi:hypothetical protein
MRTHTEGLALRDGTPVAFVTVTEAARIVGTRMVLAGSAGYGYKQRVEHLPASIRFDEVLDAGFRAELEALVSAVGDLDARRSQRDAGKSRVGFSLSLDSGERQVPVANVAWPSFALADIEQVDFPLSLPY